MQWQGLKDEPFHKIQLFRERAVKHQKTPACLEGHCEKPTSDGQCRKDLAKISEAKMQLQPGAFIVCKRNETSIFDVGLSLEELGIEMTCHMESPQTERVQEFACLVSKSTCPIRLLQLPLLQQQLLLQNILKQTCWEQSISEEILSWFLSGVLLFAHNQRRMTSQPSCESASTAQRPPTEKTWHVITQNQYDV